MQLSRDFLLRHFRICCCRYDLSEVQFAAIVDKSDGIDRAKSNSLARFERKEELQLDLR